MPQIAVPRLPLKNEAEVLSLNVWASLCTTWRGCVTMFVLRRTRFSCHRRFYVNVRIGEGWYTIGNCFFLWHPYICFFICFFLFWMCIVCFSFCLFLLVCFFIIEHKIVRAVSLWEKKKKKNALAWSVLAGCFFFFFLFVLFLFLFVCLFFVFVCVICCLVFA